MPAIFGILFLVIYVGWTSLSGAMVLPQQHTLPVSLGRAVKPEAISTMKKIDINAASAVTFDEASGLRIFAKNSDEQKPIASLTKLMTALVFLEHSPGWKKELIIQKSDFRAGSKPNFFPGDTLTVRDLFTAALTASDNTGIAALVRVSGLSEADFVGLMNLKAHELRLNNAIFKDPTGLDNNNRASAVDVAKLAEAAFKKQDIVNALNNTEKRFSVSSDVAREITATNQLLGKTLPQGAHMIAGKTGHLEAAGYCFAGVFESRGRRIVTVILGAPVDAARFSETTKLLDWALANYTWKN